MKRVAILARSINRQSSGRPVICIEKRRHLPTLASLRHRRLHNWQIVDDVLELQPERGNQLTVIEWPALKGTFAVNVLS